MKLHSIQDLQFSDIVDHQYDIGFVCSGFEARSTYVPTKLDRTRVNQMVVLGFKEGRNAVNRTQNDEFFIKGWDQKIVLVAANDDTGIYTVIRENVSKKPSIRILIDYSSMSRLWYAAFLNWARFQDLYDEIEIDFCYSIGSYVSEPLPMVIRSILAVPGFEGNWIGRRKAVVVFGIGFEGSAARCVFERLEPDTVYTYLANPAASQFALERAKKENSDLLRDATKNLELPLSRVESVFRTLSELIRPHISESRITFVAMGPKPHILAALLLGIRFPQIINLRVSGRGEKEEDVIPQGEVVVTRVRLTRHIGPV